MCVTPFCVHCRCVCPNRNATVHVCDTLLCALQVCLSKPECNCACVWHPSVCIAGVFVQIAVWLCKCVTPFCVHCECVCPNCSVTVQVCDTLLCALQVCLSKPECGRQTLQELLIRPVQRLPSIILLLGGQSQVVQSCYDPCGPSVCQTLHFLSNPALSFVCLLNGGHTWVGWNLGSCTFFFFFLNSPPPPLSPLSPSRCFSHVERAAAHKCWCMHTHVYTNMCTCTHTLMWVKSQKDAIQSSSLLNHSQD